MNILFTCAGRRNYLIKYFRNAIGHSGKILAADMQLSAPAMIDADMAFQVPSVYDKTYIEVLLQICKENNVIAIISLNDLELPILAKNKDKFETINTKIIVSSEDVIDLCFDKYKTFQFCIENNILTPKTYISLNEALSEIESKQLSFPLMLKPRWGSASIGIEIAHSIEELTLLYKILTLKLERTILATASSTAKHEAILIQEYIEGQEFGLDIINDLNGKYCNTIVKKKLAMRAGETDKALIVKDPNLSNLGNT
ncbi:MAG: ATP-grasp domain-containing protein, partial [Cyclobacteriaceae bacterium]